MLFNTIAIFPGSFNPFHIGHLDIVNQVKNIFGENKIIIAIGINPSKPINDLEYIKNNIESKTNCKVIIFNNFLHELVDEKEKEGYNVVIVRGLRNGDDLDYENTQMKFIKDFKPDIKYIFIRCSPELDHISSSSLRQLESFRPGSAKKYIV